MAALTVPTRPIAGQKPGTSGLRKKTRVFMAPGYLENYVQAIIEGAGEDPVLGAAVCAAQVRGFQGAWTSENVISGPKHYAGYGAALGGRDYDDADISDSELYNLYFPPFKGGIDAGAGNIMSAYMDLNGVPASGNRWLLTEVLRDEWGFDGLVVSDWGAVDDPTASAGIRALSWSRCWPRRGR